MKGEILKIIKISELKSEVFGERWLHQVLEHLDTFTLLECRDIHQVSLIDVTHTIILDHFDEAGNPASLLRQILNSACDIKTLIIVSTFPEFDCGDLTRINFDFHITVGGDTTSPRIPNAVYANDLYAALRLMKNRLLQAE